MIRGIDRAHDIECGPSSGMHTKGAIYGGTIVKPLQGRSHHPGNAEARRAYRAAHRAPVVAHELCGVFMPRVGQPCARRAGHTTKAEYPDHRTRSTMDKNARRRYARFVGDV